MHNLYNILLTLYVNSIKKITPEIGDLKVPPMNAQIDKRTTTGKYEASNPKIISSFPINAPIMEDIAIVGINIPPVVLDPITKYINIILANNNIQSDNTVLLFTNISSIV